MEFKINMIKHQTKSQIKRYYDGFTQRKAVSGLISMTGLVIVFGIASAAFLDINAIQTDFMRTTTIVNNLAADRTNENLQIANVTTGDNTFTVDSLWSKQSMINSYLLIDNTDQVVGKGEIDVAITAGQKDVVITLGESPTSAQDRIILITDLGTKCLVIVSDGGTSC